MSGIFGIFNRDGTPVDKELLHVMHEAMAYWGPDGGDLLYEGPVGLGQLMLYNTPEALHERLPRGTPQGDLFLTCEARIDNRQDLFAALSIPHDERPGMPDSELVLRSYRKWGLDCPDHLLGDWSFAIWDPSIQRLFLARDHHGNTALYYYVSKDFFAFASAKQALLALPGVPQRLNELYLAQVLVAWSAYHGEPTIYQEIQRLPPAHSMTITPELEKVERYWYLEDTPELKFKLFEDYVETFLEIYTEAVRCRLRSHRPVGATLSGGLDSGSVVALAARKLRAGGDRLKAFTSVPIYDVSGATAPGRFGNEWPYAEATARFASNVDLEKLPVESMSPIEGIRRALELHAEPEHAASNMYWLINSLQVAHESGLGSLLTGQGGNATVSWPGWFNSASFLNLVQGGYWKGAVKHKLLLPLIPEFLNAYYLRLRYGSEPWTAYSAIQPEFARKLDLGERMRNAGFDPTFRRGWRSAEENRLIHIRPGQSIVGVLHAELGAGYAIEVRDPTLDKRLMEYCWAVPDAQYRGPAGSDRQLIRQAMNGLLPDEVRLNTRRGYQAADICRRLLAHTQEMETVLDKISRSELVREYLDLDQMWRVWSELQVKIDASATYQSSAILLRGIMVGLFIINEEKLERPCGD